MPSLESVLIIIMLLLALLMIVMMVVIVIAVVSINAHNNDAQITEHGYLPINPQENKDEPRSV